jgi:hypothetical protein
VSRRRRPRQVPTPTNAVEVYCTDRGRHSPFHVGTLVDLAELGDRPAAPRHPLAGIGLDAAGGFAWHAGPWSPVPTRESGGAGSTFTFRCPRCRRAPQVRDDRLRAVLAAWRATAERRFDASRLDDYVRGQ